MAAEVECGFYISEERSLLSVATPLCSFWGWTFGKKSKFYEYSEETVIDKLRSIPRKDRIGLCNGRRTFGTINVACVLGWWKVLGFLLDSIPDKIQRRALSKMDEGDTPVRVCLAANRPACLMRIMRTHSHIYARKLRTNGPYCPVGHMHTHLHPPVVSSDYYFHRTRLTHHPASIVAMIVACEPYIGYNDTTMSLANLVRSAMGVYRMYTVLAEETFLKLVRFCAKVRIECFFVQRSPSTVSVFVEMCVHLPPPLVTELVAMYVTDERRPMALGLHRNALHLLASIEHVANDVYTERVQFIASLFPEWIRERDTAERLLPCEMEKIYRPAGVTMLQEMTGSTVKRAL